MEIFHIDCSPVMFYFYGLCEMMGTRWKGIIKILSHSIYNQAYIEVMFYNLYGIFINNGTSNRCVSLVTWKQQGKVYPVTIDFKQFRFYTCDSIIFPVFQALEREIPDFILFPLPPNLLFYLRAIF